jgi:hypothetical protein
MSSPYAPLDPGKDLPRQRAVKSPSVKQKFSLLPTRAPSESSFSFPLPWGHARCERVIIATLSAVVVAIIVLSVVVYHGVPSDRDKFEMVGVIEVKIYWPVFLFMLLIVFLCVVVSLSVMRTYQHEFYETNQLIHLSLAARDDYVINSVEKRFRDTLQALLPRKQPAASRGAIPSGHSVQSQQKSTVTYQ